MNFSDVFEAIKKGTVVITVNQRLARHLSDKVEQEYIKEGAVAWASPTIFSFDAWLLQFWQQRFDRADSKAAHLLINKTLLTPEQVLVLWERVIRHASGTELLNVPATAKAASKARQLSVQWAIAEGESAEFSANVDVASFKQWHAAYKRELLKGDWVDRVQLLKVVSELIDGAYLEVPKQIILTGFDVYTPTQQTCWAMLGSKGCMVTEFSPYRQTSKARVLTAIDDKEEVALMAQWARERLNESPNSVIGIVVPELKAMRELIEAAFKTAFYPSVVYAVDLPFEKPYNVSLGLSLSTYAPIQQSLRLLQFFNQPLALNELCLLLRSSFIAAGQAEWGERARLEVILRKKGLLACSVKQLRNRLQPSEDEASLCPVLLLALNEVLDYLDRKPNRVTPSEWVGLFRALLTAVGVQGDRELSSTEYQVFQVWDDVLRSFATLDRVYSVIDYSTALSALRKLVDDRVFQPETPPAAIQIMGLMEASGHTFDALWVCGLNDKTWPPAAQPNPFLPIAEQRQQGLIQSSAEHQYQYAKKMTQNWVSSAQSVIFSFSQSNGDTSQAASPLIEDYSVVSKGQLLKQLPINRVEQRLNSHALKIVEDITGPVLEKGSTTLGGVGILKDQAACPFKAYAHYRLHASAMEEPEPGIDARLRGSLVHRCLENLWLTIKTHQALCELLEDEQRALVENIVTEVVKHESKRTPILKKSFGQLESQRITKLLLDWLNIDRQREPFEVMATELKQTLEVGQLQLNTVIDRVDKLQDGSTAIIDYKTGDCSIGGWFGSRPEEPQLPLYSVFGGEGVHSISFAQLKKGKTTYQGLSDRSDSFSTLKSLSDNKVKSDFEDWNNQMDFWQRTLGTLSDEFVTGNAQVSPTDKACQYCDLTSLCRINEQTTAGGNGE